MSEVVFSENLKHRLLFLSGSVDFSPLFIIELVSRKQTEYFSTIYETHYL